MLIPLIAILSAAGAFALCALTGGFETMWWLAILPGGFLLLFVLLIVLAFLILWLICSTVDLDQPQGEEDSPFFRRLLRWYIPAVLFILQTTVHTTGLEKTPVDGRFLLVCNHLSDMDPVVLLHCFRDSQLAFISKRENRDMFIVGKIMHRILCQMINRENDREALKTILKCVDILKTDKASVAVFPEGYTSVDGRFQNFRHGVFKIAQKAKVPIVVCTLHNTQYVFGNARRLKRTRVEMHLLDVIQPEEFAGIPAVELGNWIHAMMAKDLGEYEEE